MGWKCKACGNTSSFMEVNTVNTEVVQDPESTRILRIKNGYRDEGAANAWCAKCDSEDLEWVEVADQELDYLKS